MPHVFKGEARGVVVTGTEKDGIGGDVLIPAETTRAIVNNFQAFANAAKQIFELRRAAKTERLTALKDEVAALEKEISLDRLD